jgi:non-haem Fe2+, alpha-ketoglutarate-dependent halogenase
MSEIAARMPTNDGRSMLLSPAQLAFFRENGFVGPLKVYEREEVAELWRRVRPQIRDRSRSIYGEKGRDYDRHFDIPELSSHISSPPIVAGLQSLIGPNILCWRTEFFSKMPGDMGTEWHQVESYSYGSGKAALVPTLRREKTPMELTVWTAFTDSTKETGCLKFMPGSHKHWYFDEKKGLSPAAEVVGGKKTGFFGYHYAELKVDPNWEPDESQAVHLEMKAGECVIFTARCMHGSLPNISRTGYRTGFASRYTPTDVRVYPDPDDLTRPQASFSEHGGEFDLEKFGVVLVSGRDEHKLSKHRSRSLTGFDFITQKALV